jgi:hypothetical protein
MENLFTYGDNVGWNLPLMFCHDYIIFAIGDLFKDFPEMTHPQLFAYGSVATPWSGGRCSNIWCFDKTYMEQHLNRIIDSGFIPTFTFTKPFLKKDILNDKVSNWILDYGVEHNCEFLVCSDILNTYIKDKHPNAKTNASILQAKMEFHSQKRIPLHTLEFKNNFYNERLDKYNRVVVLPEFAIDNIDDSLDKIKDISRLEVLINETCVPNCPRAINCYCGMDVFREAPICSREEAGNNLGLESMKYNLLMKKKLIDHLVYDCGIRHLKLQGRQYSVHYLYNLVLYAIFKTEGKFQTIREFILRKALEYNIKQQAIPVEQTYIVNELFRKRSLDFWEGE